MKKSSPHLKEILEKLIQFENRELEVSILTGFQIFLIVSASLFVLFIAAEFFFRFSSFIRTILFFVWSGLSLIGFLQFVLLPLLKRFNPFRHPDHILAADKIGKYFPELKDDLANALQLVTFDKKESYSKGLINAAFLSIYERVKNLRFNSAVSFRLPKKLFPYTLLAVLIALLPVLTVSGFQDASYRFFHYEKEFTVPPKFVLTVTPGNTRVSKGDDITIGIEAEGEQPAYVTLFTKDEAEASFKEEQIYPDSNGVFQITLYSLRSSFSYYASAEEIESEIYNVEVYDRPHIQAFNLSINPPRYSGIPGLVQKDNGNVSGLFGTGLSITLTATKSLSNAYLLYEDSTTTELQTEDNTASGFFRLSRDVNYRIIITDTSGSKNPSPIEYSLNVFTDEYPTIDLIEPNRDMNLSGDNRVSLLAKITDDYGFDKLTVKYRLSASKYDFVQDTFSVMEIPIDKNKKEAAVSYIWNLSSLNLATEDVVTYYLEVFDNDNISGPKSAKTPSFTLRIPSFDELFKQADETQEEVERELVQTLEEAEKLREEMDELSKELKKDEQEITWEEKEKVEKALDKMQQLQQKTEELSEKLSESREEMQENNLLSEKTLEKYMELQKLMNELTSEEMKRMMEQMQQKLESLDRREIQEQLEQMKFNEEAFEKSIERTLNLLKRIKIEQKMDEMIKRTERLMEMQEENLNQTEKTDESDKQKMNELAKKQQEISDELQRLQEEMKEMQEQMSEFDDMPNEEMEKTSDEFEKQQNQELSEQAKENLQQMQKMKSMQQQQSVSQNMQQMMEQMQNMQNMMQQANQMQVFNDMMKAIDNILNLSKEQEALKDKVMQQPNNDMLNEEMRDQHEIGKNLQNIFQQLEQLSQKTFAITPEMGKALGDASQKMNQALQQMQNRNNQQAGYDQGQAMKSLNEAVALMQNSLNSMMQSGGQGGGGMMSLMQQLGKLSGMQMGLNNMTQQMQGQNGQGQQGQYSQEQLSQMRRLAEQQEMIRKSIEELNKEAEQSGKSKSLTQDLENIAKEMQEVVSDLNTEKLNDELVQKQERILSRMLDAQRSINERDFEKERESFTGENINRESPAELNLSSKKGRDKIRDEYNNAVQEGYSSDYQNLIKRYYESLRQTEN